MSLRVDGLTVYYQSLRGDVKAVDGATFEIADGEIMGLAGESGCGKSTLGKSLIRLDARMRYVAGRVELDGQELPIWDDRRMNAFRLKKVSIIPQYALSALNPTRRIGTMVTELLASRGVQLNGMRPKLERRLELVGLPQDVLERYPIELSGGTEAAGGHGALVAPRPVAAPSPAETTSALDVSTQRAVAEQLVEFRDRGFVRSMIVITHDTLPCCTRSRTRSSSCTRASWPRRGLRRRSSTRRSTRTPSFSWHRCPRWGFGSPIGG